MSRRQPVTKGGMFAPTRAVPLSKETQQLMKVMMEESRLTNFQRRKLNESMNDRRPLPTRVLPTSSLKQQQPQVDTVAPTSFTMRGKPLSNIRTKQAIEESGAYKREKFRPKPIKSLDKEKSRLSNIMAFGEDVQPPSREETLRKHREKMQAMPKIDRFDEIQEEIEERREFLADMVAGGKGGEYGPIITAQISKLVREMEVIDQSRNAELQRQINLQEQSS